MKKNQIYILLPFICFYLFSSCDTSSIKKNSEINLSTIHKVTTIDKTLLYGDWMHPSEDHFCLGFAKDGTMEVGKDFKIKYTKWELEGKTITFIATMNTNGIEEFKRKSYKITALDETMLMLKDGKEEIAYIKLEEPEIEEPSVSYKPNIYLYPQSIIDVDVKLSFPKGGKVIKSIPEYNQGWNVSITPNGMIENKYTFLFYESEQPNLWQYESGWTIKTENLKTFFKENLKEYGFNQNEIKDFIDYWIPRLKESKYYTIYPQENRKVDELIDLEISPKPKSILRLHYVIKGSSMINKNLSKHIIKPFKRNGFTVTEWGVIM